MAPFVVGAAFAVLALIIAVAAWRIRRLDRTITAGLGVADSAAFHARVLAVAPVGTGGLHAREALAREGFRCWIDVRSPSSSSCLKQQEHFFYAHMWRVELKHPADVLTAIHTRVDLEAP